MATDLTIRESIAQAFSPIRSKSGTTFADGPNAEMPTSTWTGTCGSLIRN